MEVYDNSITHRPYWSITRLLSRGNPSPYTIFDNFLSVVCRLANSLRRGTADASLLSFVRCRLWRCHHPSPADGPIMPGACGAASALLQPRRSAQQQGIARSVQESRLVLR